MFRLSIALLLMATFAIPASLAQASSPPPGPNLYMMPPTLTKTPGRMQDYLVNVQVLNTSAEHTGAFAIRVRARVGTNPTKTAYYLVRNLAPGGSIKKVLHLGTFPHDAKLPVSVVAIADVHGQINETNELDNVANALFVDMDD